MTNPPHNRWPLGFARQIFPLNRALLALAISSLLAHAAAGTYTYAGKTHASPVNPSKSNNWNTVVSWINGPSDFPNAAADVAQTAGNVGGDVALYLNQDITLGTFSWIGNVLELWPGTPAGRLIVDNNGAPATWRIYTPYWCWFNADLVLNDSLTLSNATTIGANEPVRLNGIISGPGKLTLDWYGTSTHTLNLGVRSSSSPNTYTGGTRLQGHDASGWLFEARKNGAFGTGDVELNGYAKLVLNDVGGTEDYIANSASLWIETANFNHYAQLELGASVLETVHAFYIDGVQQPAGTYGATGSGASELLDDFITGSGQLLVTSGPVSPGVIGNLPPSSVTATSATLNGQLASANAAPTDVWIFWGPMDGGRSASAWANAVPLGTRMPGAFSHDISGYSAGQVIYYRSFLTNSLGGKWASKSVVIGPPAIQNELPYVRTNQVTLRGTITESNGLPVATTVYWGTSDGGAVAANWQNATSLGLATQASVSATISNLLPNTRYYYRFSATNNAGNAYATGSVQFTTVNPASNGEITFFVGSDPHYGYKQQVPDTDTVSRGALDRMNSLPGQDYPASIGGVVGLPRGVLIVGDITESGVASEWTAFTNDWGLNGERSLAFPLYEGYGNHDGGGGVVANSIKIRNLSRTGIKPSDISSNGFHYSWDWDFLHLVCLNLFPGNVNEPGFPSPNPQQALQFLADDLARNVGSSGRPVIIYHHYGFDSFGAGWWSDSQRTNLYNVVSNYNIAAFLSGHNHAITFTRWRGYDTYTDGTLGKSTGNFFALRVTPTNLVALERSPTNSWSTIYSKAITVPPANTGLQVSNGSGASGISMANATLNGYLTSTNDSPTHGWFYWGPADGGTNQSGWSNSIPMGALSLGAFSTQLSGLSAETLYYYRCYVSNAVDQVWADSSSGFTTLSAAPAISNSPAGNITTNSAQLNGGLSSTGAAPTTVWVYWGPADGGTIKSSWPNVIGLGLRSVGTLSAGISGLTPSSTYYFRYSASNSYGESWAASSASFQTAGLGGSGGTWFWDKGGDGSSWSGINNWSNVTVGVDNTGFPNAPGTVAINLNGTVLINPSDVTVGELHGAFQMGNDTTPANTFVFDNNGQPAVWEMTTGAAGGNVYNHIHLASDIFITNTSSATLQIFRRNITGPGKDVHITTLGSGGVTFAMEDPATSWNTFSNIHVHASSLFTIRETARTPARTPLGAGKIYLDDNSTLAVILRVWATNDIRLNGNSRITYTDDRSQGVQLDGLISGPGQLTFEHNDTSAAAGNFYLGGARSNTYSGGTIIRGVNTANNFGALVLRKNGAAGIGDIILTNEFAKLQITDGGLNDDRINDQASLRLYYSGGGGPKVMLDAGVNETVAGLYLNGAPQAAGTYGSSASTAANQQDTWFSGTGVLTVTGVENPDTDSDGIPDLWEWQHFDGLTTANETSDFDGDGMSDRDEYRAGTLPTQSASKFAFTEVSRPSEASEVVLKWHSVSGKQYTLSQSSNLAGMNWQTIVSNLNGTPPINTFTTAPSSNNQMLFRVLTH